MFWLAAGSSSRYNCNDLCNNACGGQYDYVSYGTLACECNIIFFKDKRDTSPNPAKTAILGKRYLTDGEGASVEATVAFDAIMTCVFSLSLPPPSLSLLLPRFFRQVTRSHNPAARKKPPCSN